MRYQKVKSWQCYKKSEINFFHVFDLKATRTSRQIKRFVILPKLSNFLEFANFVYITLASLLTICGP